MAEEQKRSKVKICGLFQERDLDYAQEVRPDYVGFVVNVPKSHRNISLSQLRAWQGRLPPSIATVAVVVDQPLEVLVEMAPLVDVLQLHGGEGEGFLAELRQALPGQEIWKAFSVRSKEEVDQALAFPADKILLDYGKGAGKTFDWKILEGIQGPYSLAGGLNPENVAQAMAQYGPEILDVSSGVEREGQKDLALMKQLIKEIRT